MKSMYNFLTSRTTIAAAVISFTLAVCQETSVENQPSVPSESSGSSLRTSGESEFMDGELLIQFKEGVSFDGYLLHERVALGNVRPGNDPCKHLREQCGGGVGSR